jgi:hypothetical protein
MTELYKFSKSQIDDHVEKVGFDVRPVMEYKLDRVKLIEFGTELTDAYPTLYESIVQSPTDFHLRKKFIFPGKGEMDFVTLGVTQRGPIFMFPRISSVMDGETDIEDSGKITIDCVKIFQKHFPTKKIIRVGVVNEYIFNTGAIVSTKLISEGFTNLALPPDGEIRIRINMPNDDYNRIIEIQDAKKMEQIPDIPGGLQPKGYGVRVAVDYNNRDISKNLEESDIVTLFHYARQFNEDELYKFLNKKTEE